MRRRRVTGPDADRAPPRTGDTRDASVWAPRSPAWSCRRSRRSPNAQAEDPFQILIATLLSARTQDATTHAASTRLFRRARTPRTMAKLPVAEIERLIYPVGFYRNKARHVKACCEMLVADLRRTRAGDDGGAGRAAGSRPEDGESGADPGVQERRRTSASTRTCTASPIASGWVQTRLPEETEQALYRATDARWWPLINLYLVTWGQNVCRPVHPRCGDCAIAPRLSKNWCRTR